MNDNEFYGEAYEVMKQTERRLLQLIQLYETEKEKDIPYEKVIQDELKRCAFEISSVDASMQAIRDLLKKDEQS